MKRRQLTAMAMTALMLTGALGVQTVHAEEKTQINLTRCAT